MLNIIFSSCPNFGSLAAVLCATVHNVTGNNLFTDFVQVVQQTATNDLRLDSCKLRLRHVTTDGVFDAYFNSYQSSYA